MRPRQLEASEVPVARICATPAALARASSGAVIDANWPEWKLTPMSTREGEAAFASMLMHRWYENTARARGARASCGPQLQL
jgi:hypothetical protein